MSILKIVNLVMVTFLVSAMGQSQYNDTQKEILRHGELIREAFAKGDTETIKLLHHPEVTKALGYNDLKLNRDEVMDGIKNTLESYKLEFVKNEVENILILGETAIEQTKFTIKGTSKVGGQSFLFSGRTLVTYVKNKKSPTGWATIREIIQLSI